MTTNRFPGRRAVCWALCTLLAVSVLLPAAPGARGGATTPGGERPLRVACVGDSITEFNTYEPHLQGMLDAVYELSARHPPTYEVRNFGVSGKTALDRDASYMTTQKYRDALAYGPDVVFIMLGTNDSRTGDTFKHIDQFVADYTRLIRSFLELPSHPKVYLADPTAMPNEGHWGDNDLTLGSGVIPRIHEVARALGLPVIDLHTPTRGHPEWVGDNVHPSGATAGRVMAAAICRAITGLPAPCSLYPAVDFVPPTNALSAAGHSGGAGRDIRAALLAGGPGDYFLAARVRMASLERGSPSAALGFSYADMVGQHAVASESAPVGTGGWTELRTIRSIAWSGTLERANLAVTPAETTEPVQVEGLWLEKCAYAAPAGRPDAPARLTAFAASEEVVALSWTDNANHWAPGGHTANETGYRIEWAADRGLAKIAGRAKTAADATGHTVGGLKPGATYYFRLCAFNAAGETPCANLAVATTKGAPAGPAAPTGLTASNFAGGVSLAWKDEGTGKKRSGFRLEWAGDPGFATACGTTDLAAQCTSCLLTELAPSSSYAFRVRALGAAGDSEASTPLWFVTWRAAPKGAATHVAVVPAGEDGAGVTWADDCVNETGYVVQYDCNGDFAAAVGAVTTKVNATFCPISALHAGERYGFRVGPVNALGRGDDMLNPASVAGGWSETVYLTLPPAAPGGMDAMVRSSTEIELTWADRSANETGFAIGVASDSAFTEGTGTLFVAANVTNHTVGGLHPGATCHFRVRAVNAGGASVPPAGVALTLPPAGAPRTPGELTAASVSSREIGLAWGDLSADETGFQIERATDAVISTNLASIAVGAGVTNATVTALEPATPYFFRVRAVNAAGGSASTRPLRVATRPLPPAVPGPLTVARAAATSIAVTWTDNSDNEEGFLIECADDALFAQNRREYAVPAEGIRLTVTNLPPKSAHVFRVRARNTGGNSAWSTSLEASTPAPSSPPVPAGLTASPVSEGQVELFWLAPASNEDGFRIECASDAGFTKDAASIAVPAGVSRCSVPGLAAATRYHFRVRAVNEVGESVSCRPVGATTWPRVLTASESFAAGGEGTVLGGSAAGMGWAAPWSAGSGYRIAAESLPYADRGGAVMAATGGRLAFGPSGASYQQAARRKAQAKEGQALDRWFSCLLRPGDGSRDFNPWAADAYNAGPVAQGGTTLHYFGGNAWAGGGETDARAPAVALRAGGVNLLVCRMEVPADRHAFTWTWYVNPTNLDDVANSAIRTVWTAANREGTLRGLDGFAVRSRTDSRCAFDLDEIRYGDGLADVTPHLSLPVAPDGLTAAAVSAHEIRLRWKDNSDNEAAFAIDCATDAGFSQNLEHIPVAPDRTEFVLPGLAARTTYHIRLQAINAAGASPSSPPVVAETDR